MLEEIICKYYEYFVSKFSKFPEYEFKLKGRDKKILDNFLLKLSKHYNLKSLGEEFWFDYFSFQFERFRGKTTRLGTNRVMFSWIIGSVALEKWFKKSKEYSYFVEKGLLKQFNIHKKDIIHLRKIILKDCTKLNILYENEKKIYYNLDKGFLHCLSFTMLYEKESNWCQNCKNQNLCKETLKASYPKLYDKKVCV